MFKKRNWAPTDGESTHALAKSETSDTVQIGDTSEVLPKRN